MITFMSLMAVGVIGGCVGVWRRSSVAFIVAIISILAALVASYTEGAP